MSHPRVSIVMPVYNGARFIAEALASLQSEPGIDAEIIVVDDGSTDDTTVVVSSMSAGDPRIRLLSANIKVFRQPGTSVSGPLPASTSPSSIQTTYALRDALRVRRRSLQVALTLQP